MKVLVCGSRTWRNRSLVARHIRELPPGTVIIHGAARGADSIAAAIAEFYGYEAKAYPAEWSKFGRAAGPIRNQQMLDQKPDLVIAFTVGQTPGTQDMIRRAEAANVPVRIVAEIATPDRR